MMPKKFLRQVHYNEKNSQLQPLLLINKTEEPFQSNILLHRKLYSAL